MNAAEFYQAVKEAFPLHSERTLYLRNHNIGGKDYWSVIFINLPESVAKANQGTGNGAENENNRATFALTFKTDRKPKLEMIGSVFPKSPRLRAKTAELPKLAKYLGEFLQHLASEIPPNYTHTEPPIQ